MSHSLNNASCNLSEIFFKTLYLSLNLRPVLLVVLTVLGEILMLLCHIEFLDAVNINPRTIRAEYDLAFFQSSEAHDKFS